MEKRLVIDLLNCQTLITLKLNYDNFCNAVNIKRAALMSKYQILNWGKLVNSAVKSGASIDQPESFVEIVKKEYEIHLPMDPELLDAFVEDANSMLVYFKSPSNTIPKDTKI